MGHTGFAGSELLRFFALVRMISVLCEHALGGDQREGDASFGAAAMGSVARYGDHVSLFQGHFGGAFGVGCEVFAGLSAGVGMGAFGCAAQLVNGGAVDDLHDVVATFVPLELLGGVGDFGGHDHRCGLNVDQVVVARLGGESLSVVRELRGGEDLKLLGGRWRRGVDGLVGDGETSDGGGWGDTKEVAAGCLDGHGESQTHWRLFCQAGAAIAVH